MVGVHGVAESSGESAVAADIGIDADELNIWHGIQQKFRELADPTRPPPPQ